MAGDRKLHNRARLVRRLSTLQEMLPGSFVERHRKCGKPNCRCAKEEQLHRQFQLSVLLKGKPRAFHIPAEMAEEVKSRVEMHKLFQQLATEICEINLRRLLGRKESKEKP